MSATHVEVLIDATRRAAEDFCRVLREAGDTSRLTLGGQWTVRDTAAHLIGGSKLYTAYLNGRVPAVRPGQYDVLNVAWFLVLDETDGNVLADAVEDAE
jgi:hypothetical protein